jgi:hypothetical protein
MVQFVQRLERFSEIPNFNKKKIFIYIDNIIQRKNLITIRQDKPPLMDFNTIIQRFSIRH